MLFSSTVFLFFFLPGVLLIYFLMPRTFKNPVLLLASLLFYAWGEPKFVLVMLVSIIMNYIFARVVDTKKENGSKVKWIMALMVICNLGMLGVFKYTGFFIGNINGIFGIKIHNPHFPLPIGISFFTFQAMSYVIDVYRNDGNVQKNPLNLALYISLFPQLIAGPIVRYQTVAEQITERNESFERFAYGTKRFIIGLGKKMFLANNCGFIADHIFAMDPSNMSATLAWIGVISYSLQIYFDFSGYSDMAIGLGKMFGFDFLENFNYPYISKSISEFWRRWHISLGTWFRDYVYIPLGGNKNGEIATYRNLFIVWMLTGCWHGANWTFIAWGLYYGAFIMLEKAFLGKILTKLPKILQYFYALFIVVIGWVFFRSTTFPYAFHYIGAMFGFNSVGAWDIHALYYVMQYGILLVIGILGATPLLKNIINLIEVKSLESLMTKIIGRDIALTGYYLFVLFVSIIYMVSSTFNPFIYYRF